MIRLQLMNIGGRLQLMMRFIMLRLSVATVLRFRALSYTFIWIPAESNLVIHRMLEQFTTFLDTTRLRSICRGS